MYQEIYAKFGVGQRESSIDMNGVCMATIQGIYNLLQKQAEHLEQQEAILKTQVEQLQRLRAQLEQLAK